MSIYGDCVSVGDEISSSLRRKDPIEIIFNSKIEFLLFRRKLFSTFDSCHPF
jgi:hypothetical protein